MINKTPKFLLLGTCDVFHLNHGLIINTFQKIAGVLEGKGKFYIAIAKDKTARRYKENLVFTAEERRTTLERIPLIEEIFIDDLDNKLENVFKKIKPDYICIGNSDETAKIKLLELCEESKSQPLIVWDFFAKRGSDIEIYGNEYLTNKEINSLKDVKWLELSSSEIKRRYGFNKNRLTSFVERELEYLIGHSDVAHTYFTKEIINKTNLTKLENKWKTIVNNFSELYEKEFHHPYRASWSLKNIIISPELAELKNHIIKNQIKI